MRDVRKVSFLLQLSLGIPNQWGLPQLMMEEVGGRPLLFHTLNSLRHSENLRDIWVLCSDAPCDDKIEDLVREFKKASPTPVFCLRLPEDKDWSLSLKHLRRVPSRPERFISVSGAFSLGGFSYVHERIRFDTALLAWAEFVPLLSATFLDEMIRLYSQELCFLPWGSRKIPLAILPFREVENKSQELRSEINQNWDQQKNLVQAQGRQHGQSKSDIEKKMECFRKKYVQAWSILNLVPRASSHIRLLSKLIQEEPLSPSFPACTQAHLSEIRSLWPTLEMLREHSLTAEKFLSFLASENLQKIRSKTIPDRSLSMLKLSAEHLLLDLSHATEKNLAELLSQMHPVPFVLTLVVPDSFSSDASQGSVLNPDWIPMIRALKQKQISFVQIKTAKIPEPAVLKSWAEAGLNGVLLDLDFAENKNSSSLSAIQSLVKLKESFAHAHECLIFLQISFLPENLLFIQELHARFEYLLDGIIVLPPEGKAPPIDLNVQPSSPTCLWSQNTLALQSLSTLYLCEEWREETWPLNESSLQKIKSLQGRHTPCSSCKKKDRSNGFGSDAGSLMPSVLPNPSAFTTHFLTQSISALLLSCTHARKSSDVKKLLAASQNNKLIPSVKTLIRSANLLSKQKEPALVLDVLEMIFHADPTHREARELLEKTEKETACL